MRPFLLLLCCIFIIQTSQAAELSGKTKIFPEKLWLEETASGTSLQFELCFSVKKACSPVIVLFKYLDKNGKTLLYRRLVNHHVADIERFIAVFDSKNKLRLGDSKLKAGDFCCITHPYGEYHWENEKPASVECTAYLRAEGSVEAVVWKVPVSQYNPETKLKLPFKGIWWHLEGHDTFSHHRRIFYHKNSNYFACDFMKVDKNQSICSGTGTENKDFFSFSQPILAAADGKIVTVIKGIADNPVGGRAPGFNAQDAEKAGGNTVIIEHKGGIFSYYAHLKKGSIKVSKGQMVKAGSKLGLCGNSGNSDAPHLHFHVATAPTLQAIGAAGLPPLFESFRMLQGSKWKKLENKTVLAGEIITR